MRAGGVRLFFIFNCTLEFNTHIYSMMITGIDQMLDPDCFVEGITYEINARGRVTNYDGNLVTCDPFNYFQ